MNTKHLILIALLFAGCGQAPQAAPSLPADPTPIADATPAASPSPEAPSCAVIDVCTYRHEGFHDVPIYNCVQTHYELADHPEMALSLFAGKACLDTREDYREGQGFCGPMHMPCTVQVQGPGPKAL